MHINCQTWETERETVVVRVDIRDMSGLALFSPLILNFLVHNTAPCISSGTAVVGVHIFKFPENVVIYTRNEQQMQRMGKMWMWRQCWTVMETEDSPTEC